MFTLTLYTRHKFDSREKAAELFDFFKEAGGTFKPTRFGASEPVKRVYDPARPAAPIKLLSGAPDFGGGAVMLKGSKFKFLAWIKWEAAPEAVSTWHLWLSEKFFERAERVEEFFDFVAGLCGRFPILFGGACPEEDWDAKHWVNVKGALVKSGAALDRCLPGVYWLTAFGPPVVEHFGRERIESLPARRVLDFGAGGLGLVLRDSPYEPGKAERLRQDKEVAKLLGEEYFFDAAAPEKDCRPVPSVTRGGTAVTAAAPPQARPEFGLKDLEKVTVLDAAGRPVNDPGDLAEMLVVFLQGEVNEAGDYSRASLEAIDRHFGRHPQQTEYKPEHLNREFLPALGAYFGEVLVRGLKARWVRREPLTKSTVKHGHTEVSPFEVAYRSVYEGARLSDAFDRLARLPGS